MFGDIYSVMLFCYSIRVLFWQKVFLLSFSYKFIRLWAQDTLVFRLNVVINVGISFESLLMH